MALGGDALVFSGTVEGLFQKALGARLSPAALAQLKADGLDLQAPLKPAYPEALYHRWVETAARHVFPELPREEALHRMGQEVVRGFGLTLVGRAILSVIRVLGPQRALERMTRNFHSATNYLETRMVRLGEGEFEVHINQTSGVPDYFAGILFRVLQTSGANEPSVRHIQTGAGGSVFLASWASSRAAAG